MPEEIRLSSQVVNRPRRELKPHEEMPTETTASIARPRRHGRHHDPTRPSRLAVLTQWIIVLLLGGAFITGGLLWWGGRPSPEDMGPPSWLSTCRIIHGTLNPFLCALFGYLVCHHIRYGWHLRANLISGFVMEAIFLGLILTGIGNYYAGSEAGRAFCQGVHRWLGIALPVSLAIHWIYGRRWAAQIPAAPPA